MSFEIINGVSIPNIPWQDRPAGCTDTVWRYDANPIIPRDLLPGSNSIFNSAVVPFNGGGFAGDFRVDDKARRMAIHAGFSEDGVHWRINSEKIEWINDDPAAAEANTWCYGYDPRCAWIEDRYWITWCNGYNGFPTIGIGWTKDFREFHQTENAFLPFNRNGVLFPRKIGGEYVLLSRPSDNGHTPFGDMYLSRSKDMTYWGKHRLVMRPEMNWESLKLGAGPIPIETSEGWLVFYHGVLQSCNGYVYSFGTCILDIEEPWRVKYRCEEYLLAPREPYECIGDVQNVTFPCAALCDKDTGRIAIYYGCADTCTSLAFCYAEEVVEYVKAHSKKYF